MDPLSGTARSVAHTASGYSNRGNAMQNFDDC